MKILKKLWEIIVCPFIFIRTAGARNKLVKIAEADKKDILNAPENAEFLKNVRKAYKEENKP